MTAGASPRPTFFAIGEPWILYIRYLDDQWSPLRFVPWCWLVGSCALSRKIRKSPPVIPRAHKKSRICLWKNLHFCFEIIRFSALWGRKHTFFCTKLDFCYVFLHFADEKFSTVFRKNFVNFRKNFKKTMKKIRKFGEKISHRNKIRNKILNNT